MTFLLRTLSQRRAFTTSRALLNTAPSSALKKPVGAFRGGIFGFLLGSTVSGIGSYWYVYEEYKVANDLLTEDIDALRSSIQRLELHLRSLEEVVANNAVAAAKAKK